MEAEQPVITTMEGCMFAGDLRVKNVNKRMNVIVGDTRIGKSTLFNYFIDVPMKGVETEDEDFQLKPNYQKGAAMKYSLQSVTLVPNIDTVIINKKEEGLADMAGFSDEARGYIGTYGVSYMLEKLFSSIQEFKIILVVSAPKFQMDQAGQIISPFITLVTLFRKEVLLSEANKAVLQKLLQSIAIVVAKSTKSQKFYNAKLKKIIDFLAQQQKKGKISNERRIARRIMESILQNGRIELFQKAKSSQQLPKCKILQKLNQAKKNWNFYSFSDPKNLKKQAIIQLPFSRQYKKMQQKLPQQKAIYLKSSQLKKTTIRKTYDVMSSYVAKSVSNWYADKIDYSDQFEKLKQIVRNHPYGNIDLMVKYLDQGLQLDQSTQRNVTRLELMKELENISEIVEDIDKKSAGILDSSQKLKTLQKLMRNLLKTWKRIFCQNAQQEKEFLAFMFINLRNLYEASMQSKIDGNACADIPMIVTDKIKYILPKPITELKAEFLKNFKAKKSQNQKYNTILQQITKNRNLQLKDSQAKDFHLLQSNNFTTLGNNFLNKKKYKQALQKYLKSNDELQKYKQFESSLEDEAEKKEFQENCQYKQRKIFKKIGLCLENLRYYALALKLYDHGMFVGLLMDCFHKYIDAASNKKNKYLAMLEYVKALKKYGKSSEVIKTYQKMLDEFECYQQGRKQIKKQLIGLLQSKNSSQQQNDYIQLLQDESPTTNNPQLMQQIEQKVSTAVEDYDIESQMPGNEQDEEVEDEEDLGDEDVGVEDDDQAFMNRREFQGNGDGDGDDDGDGGDGWRYGN